MVMRVAVITPLKLVDMFPEVSCIQRKWPSIVIPIRTQGNLFNDVSGAGWGPDLGRRVGGERVASPGKVIELVFVGISRMFPDAHAEIPILRRPS